MTAASVPAKSHLSLKTASAAASPDIAVGADTILLEAAALTALASSLDARFTQAVEQIVKQKGRVIVTGIGKAGHIGKKITATLASTGTPCHFVHPAEASHGDLGMIDEDDTVLALSKSGESKELGDIINYCKRFSIRLIAMTMKPDSTLGRQADLILELPETAEACPNQQAPTTSTVMMLGLGDALAIALMKRRGFSATDFRQYHPGGKLGGHLLSVAAIMHKGDDLPLIGDHATVHEAQYVMSAKKYGCAIVVDAQNHIAGFISDGDIRRYLSPELPQKAVTLIMSKTPFTIAVDALASAALAMMNQNNITQLIVLDGATPVGLLRLHDILRAGVA